ncbi:MAG: hypothetical protein M1326_08035 [Cyanobacteria bacterium]|nr:hypothetical protein [Cyanobacteriota bacterium]
MYKKAAINITYIVTMIIVFILVFVAIYTNFDKFLPKHIEKYTEVNIENGMNFDEIISKYATIKNREAFIAEVKRVNKLENIEYTDKKSIIIPIIESE